MDAGGHGHLSQKSPHASRTSAGNRWQLKASTVLLLAILQETLSVCLFPTDLILYTESAWVEDWMVARCVSHREESPDSMGRALGNSQAEQSDTSTTEIKPPMANATGSHLVAAAQVRVKRWGKSPPRWW